MVGAGQRQGSLNWVTGSGNNLGHITDSIDLYIVLLICLTRSGRRNEVMSTETFELLGRTVFNSNMIS